MSPETEYNELMDEKRGLNAFIEKLKEEISSHKIQIEVAEWRISEAEDRLIEIDARLDEIRGP